MNRSLVALLLFAAAAVSAQTAEPKFDASVTSLPAKYTGNDFARVFQAFTSGGPKGEFETTAAYEARRASLPAGRYAFVIHQVIPPKYDADRETFTLTHYTTTPIIDGKRDITKPAFVVSTKDTDKKTYKATTVLGVTFDVTSRAVVEQLLVSRLQGELVTNISFDAKVPAAEAEALKPRLQLLLVTELDAKSPLPPTTTVPERYKGATGFRYHEPTLSAAHEVSTYQYALAGDVLGVWVFDEETGRVFGKFDPEGKPVESTTALPRRKLSHMQTYELQKQINRGMTKEQVATIMGGPPSSIIQSEYIGDKVEIWAYEDAYLSIIFNLAKGTVETTRDLPRR